MHTGFTKTIIGLSTAAVAIMIAAGPATAAPKPSLGGFFAGGNGSAGWTKDVPHGSDQFTIRLAVPDADSYAGVEIKHVGEDVPSTAPSFQFMEEGTASGGSPRLVIEGSNGCVATEYALVDGGTSYSPGWHTAGQWDLMGSCGYTYNASYADVQAAFADAAVESVFVVSDSYGGGHTDYVDDIQYDGTTFSAPGDKK
jgi:hypothetical protein